MIWLATNLQCSLPYFHYHSNTFSGNLKLYEKNSISIKWTLTHYFGLIEILSWRWNTCIPKGVATLIKLTFKPSFKPLKVMAAINNFIPLNYLQTTFKLASNHLLTCVNRYFAYVFYGLKGDLKVGLKAVWSMVWRCFKPT